MASGKLLMTQTHIFIVTAGGGPAKHSGDTRASAL
jgi:hypothetical protein